MHSNFHNLKFSNLSFILRYSKDRKDNPKQWNAYICMEDPFTLVNTGRAVMNRDKFDKILDEFYNAQRKLPACILQCLPCLNDRCHIRFHKPPFYVNPNERNQSQEVINQEMICWPFSSIFLWWGLGPGPEIQWLSHQGVALTRLKGFSPKYD